MKGGLIGSAIVAGGFLLGLDSFSFTWFIYVGACLWACWYSDIYA